MERDSLKSKLLKLVALLTLSILFGLNCNEGELEKFETTHELDSAINLGGLRFRANFYNIGTSNNI